MAKLEMRWCPNCKKETVQQQQGKKGKFDSRPDRYFCGICNNENATMTAIFPWAPKVDMKLEIVDVIDVDYYWKIRMSEVKE